MFNSDFFYFSVGVWPGVISVSPDEPGRETTLQAYPCILGYCHLHHGYSHGPYGNHRERRISCVSQVTIFIDKSIRLVSQ